MKAKIFISSFLALTLQYSISCGNSSGPSKDIQQDGDVPREEIVVETPNDPLNELQTDESIEDNQDGFDSLENDLTTDELTEFEEVIPDAGEEIPSCVAAGCVLNLPETCCSDLVSATECDPTSGDPECTINYCILKEDGVCSPHENCYNSISDCRNPCNPDVEVTIICIGGQQQNCKCKESECKPVCRSDSGGGYGWYDSCTGDLIREDNDCAGQTAECGAVCTRSEGWYESRTGERIKWDFCSPKWECIATP